MKNVDRCLQGALAVGVWVLIIVQMTARAPAYADMDPDFSVSISAYEIGDLTRFVVNTVERCAVVDGDRVSCQ